MKDFTYRMPTRIAFGRGTPSRAGEFVRRFGGTRVLLVYGSERARKSEVFGQVSASLAQAGLYVAGFGGIQPNPRLSQCLAGMELVRAQKLDFILAVGGGSVMDAAKCIALGAYHDGDIWDYFLGRADAPGPVLPVGAVPTLPASGSENNSGMVITDERSQMKIGVDHPALFPGFALLDPAATFTLPPYQTAAGGIDAIAHALMFYFDRDNANAVLRAAIEELVKMTVTLLPQALERPDDYDVRAALMWGAAVCCNGSLGAGNNADTTSHRLQYELGALYDITHGAGLAVTVPAWLRYIRDDVPGQLAALGERVFGTDGPDDCIDAFESFFESLGMPTRMSGLGIDNADYRAMADKIYSVFGEYGCVKRCGPDETVELYRLCE